MRGWQRTKAARGPGGGSGSQRQVVARDDVIRLAHPEYLDQLARALNPAEVGSVVDDLSGKRLGEPGDALELFEGGGVEVGPGDEGPGRSFGEGHADLFTVPQATREVGHARAVGVFSQSARGGNGVEDPVAPPHPVKAGMLDGPAHVDEN